MRRHSEQIDSSFFRCKREPFSYSERRLPVDDDAVAKELTLRMKEIKACFAKEMVHTHTHTHKTWKSFSNLQMFWEDRLYNNKLVLKIYSIDRSLYV
jgi:hypothetical protein